MYNLTESERLILTDIINEKYDKVQFMVENLIDNENEKNYLINLIILARKLGVEIYGMGLTKDV